MPREYKIIYGYVVTENKAERTCTIYSRSGEFLSTVNDGELSTEIRELDRELGAN